MYKRSIKGFLAAIGYEEDESAYIETALTHSSYVNETNRDIQENEKFEFLGDAVLSLAVAEYTFNKYTDMDEGELTRLRASIVCEKNLSECAKRIKLGKYILLGRGEVKSGGQNKASILADTMEAVIGAVFLEKGLDQAREFIIRQIVEPYMENNKGLDKKDYKSLLQEMMQKDGAAVIEYKVTRDTGPAHNKTFYISVYVNDSIMGRGEGKTKKQAEQVAAKAAYLSMENRL